MFCDGNGFGKSMIIFGTDMSSSEHVDNRNKDMLIIGKCQTQGFGDTTLISEKEYSISFTEQHKKCCLSLHYNVVNSYIFLMILKYANSKQKILNQMQLHYV